MANSLIADCNPTYGYWDTRVRYHCERSYMHLPIIADRSNLSPTYPSLLALGRFSVPYHFILASNILSLQLNPFTRVAIGIANNAFRRLAVSYSQCASCLSVISGMLKPITGTSAVDARHCASLNRQCTSRSFSLLSSPERPPVAVSTRNGSRITASLHRFTAGTQCGGDSSSRIEH